ncbi:hypothetical protein L596_007305 [Steinernema carpocapsae]|uniref:Uncharacterized protein n=1 Tax=Steinernema carpocapsae TaxID=34508 RepID=A0A4U5P9W4_STECR|nr:hypothetical protein L596_007305 [Steinernema carpocapsae]
MRWITILAAILSVLGPSLALHCLVLSPGRGLVAHKCTQSAVGCRIRVERDSVSWYDLTRAYDKHLACLLKGELGAERKSGCVKKPSGTVRCWCYGQSNCNSPEKSRRLYEAFASSDSERLDREVVDIDTEDPEDYTYDSEEEATLWPNSISKPTEAMKTTLLSGKSLALSKKKSGEKKKQTKSKHASNIQSDQGKPVVLHIPAEIKPTETSKIPVAIEIKTQDNDDLDSVEYLPDLTTIPPVLPTTSKVSDTKKVCSYPLLSFYAKPISGGHALPTDATPEVFDTYSLMEEAAADYGIESETKEPEGHYKVNVVKIRSKEAEPSQEEHNSAATVFHAIVLALLVLISHNLF